MLRVVEDDGVRYLGAPHAAVAIRGIEYRHNSLGLRDDELAADGAAGGEFRILVLGDSTTYGWGVRQEETFCAVLERLLNERRAPGTPPFAVVNAGQPGYNARDEEALFRRLRERVRPALVLLVWYPNDLERLGFHLGLDGFMFCDPLPAPERWKPLLWCSFLYRRISAGVLARMQQDGSYVFAQGENLSDCASRIAQLRLAVAAQGARLALVDLPWLQNAQGSPLLQREGYPGAEQSAWLSGIAAAEGLPLLPLIDALAGEPAARYWYLLDPPDQHPNALAHERCAQALLGFLVEQRLVPLAP
ncbi:MAG: hypothetical protein HY812_05850 [Planctomycetes bacterium]|nr:hypothetical protein [Planctomycetota bacterium]